EPDQGFVVVGDQGETLPFLHNGDAAGSNVAASGDINGDGFDDLVIGAPGGDDGGTDAGEAYVIFGRGSAFGDEVGGRQTIDLTTLDPDQGFIIRGNGANAGVGRYCRSAGDINGDGFDDLFVSGSQASY